MGFWETARSVVGLSSPGQQVGEAASAAVGGIFDGFAKLIDEFHLSPEKEAAVRVKVEEMRLQFYQAMTADVQSARAMQIATRSWWPGILSFVTLIGFYASGWYIIAHGLPATSAEGRDVIVAFANTLMNGVLIVYGFWLGTSHGSKMKDAALFQNGAKKKDD